MPGLPKGGPLGALYKLSNVSRRVAARLKRDKLRKQLKKEEAEGTGPKLETKPAPKIKEVVPKSKKKLLSKQKPASKKGRQEEIDTDFYEKDFDRMFWREHGKEYIDSLKKETQDMVTKKAMEIKARSKHPGRKTRLRQGAKGDLARSESGREGALGEGNYSDRGKVARKRAATGKYNYEAYHGPH